MRKDRKKKAKEKIYVALDKMKPGEALDLARWLTPYVGGFKVGPGLALSGGRDFLIKIKACGKLFLDFKFFDIPSSMYGSIWETFLIGADLVTCHAGAGGDSLRLLSGLEKKCRAFSGKSEFRILAVTILTSFDKQNLVPYQRVFSLYPQVESLAGLAIRSGITGLVCSVEEAKLLKKRYPGSWIITPGIRMPDRLEVHDQKRVSTPAGAMKAGADGIVVGRAITQSKDPEAVCVKILDQLLSVSL